MEDGGPHTSLRDLAQELQNAESQAEKENVLARGPSKELQESHKKKEVEFKASHGLLIAFAVLIMYVLPAIILCIFSDLFFLVSCISLESSSSPTASSSLGWSLSKSRNAK